MSERPSNFINDIIDADLANGIHQKVVTRFPPEPNGFLHIGHAKSICLNFGLAEDYQGQCHLRMDDTNPEAEDARFADAMVDDIHWLGFDWGTHHYHASDYFERLYGFAVELVEKELAYVDHQTIDEIRTNRGTLTEPGTPSPYRDRSACENLELLARMRHGDFADGACVLRAKIDMAHPNMKLRDPLLYRIRHVPHHRVGDAWNIYPMYDFAHPLEDAIEGITHSICTLEFENNRAVYDWLITHCSVDAHPKQYEFARLSLGYTVMSKRKLAQLVKEGLVDDWNDPRLPTIAGMRRRGIRPEAIRRFCDLIGVAKANSTVDLGKLEYVIRDDLNLEVPRVMAVLDPLKVVLTNYPKDQVETMSCALYPHDVPKTGERDVPFGQVLYIERSDFQETPVKGFFRLAPGREVRLRYAYFIRCDQVIKDPESGEVIELRCSYDPATRGGSAPDGRKVKGTLHWVSAAGSIPATVRLYDRLFNAEFPGRATGDPLDDLNPDSLTILDGVRIEPSIANDPDGSRYQFERQGYFIRDSDSTEERPVYNRIITLRDSWAKKTKKSAKPDVKNTPAKPTEKKADTRPKSKTRRQFREEARAVDPVLSERFTRYQTAHKLTADQADLLTGDYATGDFFDTAIAAYNAPESVARWMINDLLAALKDKSATELPFTGPDFAALVALVDKSTISGRAAKQVLEAMLETGTHPNVLVDELGLRQIDDPSALAAIVTQVIAENPGQVAAYRGGKTQLLGFLVGQIMKASRGKANPQQARTLLTEVLG